MSYPQKSPRVWPSTRITSIWMDNSQMNELLDGEIAQTLARHQLIEPQGWSRARGVIEYECSCGETLIVDTRTDRCQSRDTLLAEHQASEVRSLGLRREPDHLDFAALEIFASEVLRRRSAAAQALSESHATSTELTRLEGALAELNGFAALVEGLMVTRASSGNGDLFALEPRFAWRTIGAEPR
ncbi:hypothetical protein [Microcella pacifica]|uniref:Uncharacterized protein n=1 Tax=Microcella pacifica TaxID=2591847 RepID=A0A9E5JL74_9MICO|nr:hypothetical protein [Microcella pacifica]NHF62489.1 hypothetical protein [Microcella pacifica]